MPKLVKGPPLVGKRKGVAGLDNVVRPLQVRDGTQLTGGRIIAVVDGGGEDAGAGSAGVGAGVEALIGPGASVILTGRGVEINPGAGLEIAVDDEVLRLGLKERQRGEGENNGEDGFHGGLGFRVSGCFITDGRTVQIFNAMTQRAAKNGKEMNYRTLRCLVWFFDVFRG